jgi:hypothetical protein
MRFTWKGAFLSTWKLTEPVRTWRMRLRDRKARRKWRDLGMDGWWPPAEANRPAAQAGPQGQLVAPDAGAALQYETALAEGEVREEWAGEALTVRAGMPTRNRVLLRHWSSFLWIGLGVLALAMFAWTWWRLALRTGTRIAPIDFIPWALILIAVFLLLEVYKVVRAVRTARGTVVITANRRGLWWRNVPAWRHAGHVTPDDIEGLVVRPAVVPFRLVYRLELLRRDSAGRGRVLLMDKNKDAMERLRAGLARALGIESVETQAQTDPKAAQMADRP